MDASMIILACACDNRSRIIMHGWTAVSCKESVVPRLGWLGPDFIDVI